MSPNTHRRGRSPTQRSRSPHSTPETDDTEFGSSIIFLCIRCILFSFGTTLVVMFILYPNEVTTLLNDLPIATTSRYRHDQGRNHETTVAEEDASKYGTTQVFDDPNAIVYTIDITSYCTGNSALRTDTPECRNLLNDEIKTAFQEDGVIALRGLLSPQLLNSLNQSSMHVINDQVAKTGRKPGTSAGKQFFTTKMGAMFSNTEDISTGFRDVALSSLLPQISAELMGIDELRVDVEGKEDENRNGTSVHMLRDVFLAKDADEYICGWHVDDYGFWPATADSKGINAWIAIDDMPANRGGGFALSVGSHVASWRHKAYEFTGSSMTMPEEGYKSAEDMFKNRKGAGTCNIQNVAPELNEIIESGKRVYDLKAGDIIFHTRWLFHRTIPFRREVIKESRRHRDSLPLLYRRYSVRYAPGTARLPNGYGAELSILWNENNQGRTIDNVDEDDGPWYPKCWPNAPTGDYITEIKELVKGKLPFAQERRKERMDEMSPYLKEIGQQQRNQRQENVMKRLPQLHKEL